MNQPIQLAAGTTVQLKKPFKPEGVFPGTLAGYEAFQTFTGYTEGTVVSIDRDLVRLRLRDPRSGLLPYDVDFSVADLEQ